MDFEIWVLVDAAGDYAVGSEADAARSSYTDNIGALEDGDGFRMVKVTVFIPLPGVAELKGAVPASGEPAKLISANPA